MKILLKGKCWCNRSYENTKREVIQVGISRNSKLLLSIAHAEKLLGMLEKLEGKEIEITIKIKCINKNEGWEAE